MMKDPPPRVPATAARVSRPAQRRAAADQAPPVGKGRGRGKAEVAGLQARVEASESLVAALRAELAAMRELMERLRSLNEELERQNLEYERDLCTAEAKIRTLEERLIKDESTEIKSKVLGSEKKSIPDISSLGLQIEGSISGSQWEVIGNSVPPPVPHLAPSPVQDRIDAKPAKPPPPPPPPPAKQRCSMVVTMQKAPSLVEFYHSLTKRGRERVCASGLGCVGAFDSKAHTSIVGEIQNRSAHLLAIKTDVESKGDFINLLIEKVQSADYSDIEDLSTFVDWLDNNLSTLADERAVLKHFNWPERKADAMREASMEYRALKRLENEVHLFQDDPCLSFESILKKMEALLDKLERSIVRLTSLRNTAMHIYKEANIPIDWMLDSGVISKVKVASIKLAKVCMRRVSTELESVWHCEKETLHKTVLLQCIRFAYRVHQFAGGLDMEAMSVFEELRQQVSSPYRGSRELLTHIAVL